MNPILTIIYLFNIVHWLSIYIQLIAFIKKLSIINWAHIIICNILLLIKQTRRFVKIFYEDI